jgi:hypothetical protein
MSDGRQRHHEWAFSEHERTGARPLQSRHGAVPRQDGRDLSRGLVAPLEPYTYSVQWYSVGRRETKGAGKVTVEDHTSTSFTAPFAEAGPAALYLRRVGR